MFEIFQATHKSPKLYIIRCIKGETRYSKRDQLQYAVLCSRRRRIRGSWCSSLLLWIILPLSSSSVVVISETVFFYRWHWKNIFASNFLLILIIYLPPVTPGAMSVVWPVFFGSAIGSETSFLAAIPKIWTSVVPDVCPPKYSFFSDFPSSPSQRTYYYDVGR